MIRLTLPILLLALAGCCTPSELVAPAPTSTPSDALLLADPSAVTNADLAFLSVSLGVHHQVYSMVEGVTWEPVHHDPATDEPDGFGKGGDSALFTGYALAAYSFQFAYTGDVIALHRALSSLRGVWYLTHVGGEGVIARCAFPLADAAKWNYPNGGWAGRIKKHPGFVEETDHTLLGPPLPAPLNDPFAPSVYYTRATRDQLTGLVFGLSVAWVTVPQSRDTVKLIAEHLYNRLDSDGWRIRNEDDKNDTNADDVDGLLKTALLRLYATTSNDPAIHQLYESTFVTSGLGDLFNWGNNASQYYSHNLRAARALSAWMLEDDADHKAAFAAYFFENVWRHTKGHQNAWFAYIAAAMGETSAAAEGRAALASLSLRPTRAWPSPYAGQEYTEPNYICAFLGNLEPYVLPPHLRYGSTSFFFWQKQPWRVEPVAANPAKPPIKERTGLGFLLPYWMARYFGQLP